MADNFKKIIDNINKELTAQLEVRKDKEDEHDEWKEAESPLDFGFIKKAVEGYHVQLKKDLVRITDSVKNWAKSENKQNRLSYLQAYQNKLMSELRLSYPELATCVKKDKQKTTEGGFTFRLLPLYGSNGFTPYFENRLSQRVQNGLKNKFYKRGEVQKIVNTYFGSASLNMVFSHMSSVGFEDASKILRADKQKETATSAVKTKESDTTLKSVMSLTNNQPGNWVITSGMFSGKKVNDLVKLLFDNTPEGDALAVLKKKLRLEELDITKAQVKLKDAKIAMNVSLYRIGWGSRAEDLEGLLTNPHALKHLPPNLIRAINALFATEARVRAKISAYKDAEAAYKVRYQPYHQLRLRAATWFLDKHVTLIANPKPFEKTFGRTSASRNSGLSPAFIAMFKHVFTDGDLLKHALNVKGISLAQEYNRENDSFYQILQYYTDRKGVARSVIVTKYVDPRKKEGEGTSVHDQGEKERENLWEKTSSPGRNRPKNTVGQYATGRVYNKDKTRMTDKEVIERRKQEDIGMVGRYSMMRGLRLAMNVHDRVRYDRLQDALNKMPRKTSKEFVTNPLTGETKLMRKGAELGMMMAYDKHGKLVWKEFDIYAGARRSFRGQLQHLTEKEVERQGIKGYGEDKEVEMLTDKLTGGAVDLTKIERRGVGRDGKGKGRTGAQAAEQAEENERIMQSGGEAPVVTGREMLDKRNAYADMIKDAKTEDHLKEIERKIYNSLNKKKPGTDEYAIRENKLAREQLDKFREGSDLLPEFYGDTAPLLSMQNWRKMYSGTLEESNAIIKNFVSEQTAYYSNKHGPGQAITLENKFRSEYHSVDYQLPIATQIAVRKMEFRNSGNKP